MKKKLKRISKKPRPMKKKLERISKKPRPMKKKLKRISKKPRPMKKKLKRISKKPEPMKKKLEKEMCKFSCKNDKGTGADETCRNDERREIKSVLLVSWLFPTSKERLPWLKV